MRGLSTLTALPLLFVAVAQGALFYEASVQNFDLVNDLRKSEGSSALQWNEHLYQKALQWSKQMFEEDRLHHSDYNLAENVAFGHNSYSENTVARGFFEQWSTSKLGHRENMISPMHRCGAVAIYGDGTRFYGTQLFDTNCGEIAGSTGALYNQSMDNFALVNAFRTGEGESKIEWDEHLYEMAMNWSTIMYYEQRLYHSDYNIAENVASANRLYTLGNVAQGFFDQWEASTRGHRENMLYPSHRCGAAAIFGDGSVFYGTQLFARSCRVSTDSPAMPGTTPLSSSSQDTEGSPSAKPSPDAFEILSEILDNEKVSSTPEYSQFSAVSQDFVSEPPIEVSGENEESGDAVVGNLYEPQPFTALDESPSGEHHAGNSLEPSQTVTPQPSTKPALLPSLGPSQELLHSAEVAFSLPGETQASTTDYSEIAFSTVPTFDEKSISYVSTSAEEEVDTEPSSTPYSQDEPFETAELSTDMDMSSPPIIFSIPDEPSQINPFPLIGMVSSRPSEDSFVQKPFLASGPMEISEEFLSASAAVEVDASESPVVTAIVPPKFSHNPSVSDGAEVAQTSLGTSDAESAVGIISVNPTITPEISIRASIQPSRTPSPDPVAILLPEIANPSEQDDGLLESSGLHDTEALLYLLRSEEPGEELETTLSPSSVYTIKTPVPSPTATATEISREEFALIAKARRLSQLLDGLDRVLSVCISRLGTGSALCGIVVREVQSTGNMIAECEKRIEQVHEAEEAQL